MSKKETAARMAGEWWAERLQQGDKDKFAQEIKWRVFEELQREKFVFLECDYDPHGILLDAVHAIGIECRGMFFSADGILPRKHSLRVTESLLEPKEGYGNWKDVIPVPDEENDA